MQQNNLNKINQITIEILSKKANKFKKEIILALIKKPKRQMAEEFKN